MFKSIFKCDNIEIVTIMIFSGQPLCGLAMVSRKQIIFFFLNFDIWGDKLGCLTGEILCEIESLPNIEIWFNIWSLPNIAKVRTYYSAWTVCGPYSVVELVGGGSVINGAYPV